MRRSHSYFGLCFVCLAVLWFVSEVSGRSASSKPVQIMDASTPTRVASINLGRILEELMETQAVRTRFDFMLQEVQAHRAEREEAIQIIQDELETLPPESEKFIEYRERILLEVSSLNAWIDTKQQMAELLQSQEYIRLYHKITAASDDLAIILDIDFILLDDSGLQVEPGRPADTIAQLFTRRMIYGNPDSDLTDELITRMNNTFAAGE